MNKSIYNNIAKQINSRLTLGRVEVVDTRHIDPRYCDKWSLRLDDDIYDLLHEFHDTDSVITFFDTIYETGNNRYYIEPYNTRLFNIALL